MARPLLTISQGSSPCTDHALQKVAHLHLPIFCRVKVLVRQKDSNWFWVAGRPSAYFSIEYTLRVALEDQWARFTLCEPLSISRDMSRPTQIYLHYGLGLLILEMDINTFIQHCPPASSRPPDSGQDVKETLDSPVQVSQCGKWRAGMTKSISLYIAAWWSLWLFSLFPRIIRAGESISKSQCAVHMSISVGHQAREPAYG